MINAPHVAASAPSSRVLNAATGFAALLAMALFAIDVWVRHSVELGVLYVVPLLVGALGGPPRFLPIAGVVASILTIAAGWIVDGPSSSIGWGYRAIGLGVIWTAVIVLSRARQTWLTLQSRTKDLADVNYALDQSAIVAITDTKGAIKYVNDKFCEISKYPREELLGQDHRILNSGYHPKEFIRNLWVTIANGRIWRGELRNRAKDGTIYWVDTTIVPFLDDRGKPYQYMAIRYEITERKRSEERLREQAALARLGEMAAVVAHEVKNPIAGIRGALQVIGSRMAESPERAVIGDIIARLDALNRIVQDLLVFARPRELRLEPVHLKSLIVNTAEMVQRDPALSGIRVDVSGDGAAVQADSEQLQLVFQNIVMNAAQAMNGSGRVAVTIEPADAGWKVSIADHGPGMPPDVLSQAFDAFFTTKHRGTGLGLPIARRIVEAHAGQIRIESPPAGGTVVSIYLPSHKDDGSHH
jgi:PAS domain S-box-containing protein